MNHKDYWNNPKEYQDRNAQMLKDKKTMSVLELSIKYGISGTRVLAIIRREKQKLIKEAK